MSAKKGESRPAPPTISSSEELKSPRFLESPPFSFFRSSSSRSPRQKARSLSSDGSISLSMKQETPSSPTPSSPRPRAPKYFPRSTTLPSIVFSDQSTLIDSSPRLVLRHLDDTGVSYESLKKDVLEQGPESPLRSVQLSGITVLLSGHSKVPVSVRVFLNDAEFLKLPFRDAGDSSSALRWDLQPHLTIRADTKLVLQVRKRRRWPKNPVLAEGQVSYDQVIEALGALELQDDVTTHALIIHQDPAIIVDLIADVDPLQANLQVAAKKSKEVRSTLDRLGRSRHFLESLIAYGAAVSELDPIAKAVLSTVKVAYKQLMEHERCHRVIVNLAEHMARTLGYVEDIEQFARLAQLKRALEDIRPLMEDTANFILKFVNRSATDKAFKTSIYRDEVDALKKRYEKFQEQFDRGLAVQSTIGIENVLKRLSSSEDDQILQELKPKGLPTFQPFTECMKGTREDVLSTIDEWVHDFEAPNILWIRGFPGVGKTAIASTVISQLRSMDRLGARFIFQRDQETLSTPNALWRTVAYELARLYPSVRKTVVERIREEDVDVETSNAQGLFRELVEEPLEACTDIPVGRLPVIVVDALDECGGRDGRQSLHRSTLLQTLKRWPNLPSRFKLIVTSRIEDDISRVLTPISEVIDLSTGRTVEEKASHDICLFLKIRFFQISEQYDSLPSDWPGTEVIEDLTRRAAGLFLWAKTAAEFVSLGEPTGRLRQIIDGIRLGDVSQLYAKVLDVSFRSPSPGVPQAFQDIVGAMIFAKRPLTKQDALHLLPYPPVMLEFVWKGLHSVLDQGDVLRFSHQSFVEFLLSSGTCPPEFRIEETPQQQNLAKLTLKLMLEELRFNICQFPTSHRRNSAVSDLSERAERFITSPLIYASCFWTHHIEMVPFDQSLFQSIKRLLHEKLLYWFEVLSIVGEIYNADELLQVLLKWMQPSGDAALIAFVEDAIKFLGVFAGIMFQSVPHIYISALPFAPENSLVACQYLPYFPRTIKVTRGRSLDWPRVVFTIDEHGGAVNSVAYSSKGKFIVSASSDRTIRVWDAATGDLTSGPMEGHEGYVTTAVFSPDGTVIASGSDDCTVRLWDAQSGEQIGNPLQSHSNLISCVAFSPTGDYLASASSDKTVHFHKVSSLEDGPSLTLSHPAPVNTIAFSTDGARIASGCSDRMVRVWDARSGELLNGPFEGHTDAINCVVFSSDGTTIASASEDETIRLWDLVANEIIGEPLEGHTDAVTSIAFAPDARKLISGAHDGILLLWDVQSGALLCEFTGHRNGVTSVAFSRDGKRVLSGSCDETIAVWDAESLQENFSLTPILDIPVHQDNVKCVAFSPDGRFIASGSDDETLRVWDAESGKQLSAGFHRDDLAFHHWYRFPSPPTHKQGVEVVSYSPDGSFIASGGGHNDETICIWNSGTGQLHTPALQGHTGGITSLVWFPDSTRLASSSYDDTIRIWNIVSGDTVAGPFVPHDSWVTCLAITSDGKWLASASRDRTIRVMDAETLKPVGAPLEGHDGAVNCVAFCPEGQFLVSGSNDRSVRLWDPRTGSLVRKISNAHRNFILSVAVSNDGRYIASASVDKTIKIWNAATGGLHLGPLQGHTGAIFSVVFNHDGTRLASCAEDETIRVWNVSSMNIDSALADARPAEFADDSGYHNGWIVRSRENASDCLLFWVPPWGRSGVWWPRNTAVIAEQPVKLDLSSFAHGEEWYRCTEPMNEWV